MRQIHSLNLGTDNRDGAVFFQQRNQKSQGVSLALFVCCAGGSSPWSGLHEHGGGHFANLSEAGKNKTPQGSLTIKAGYGFKNPGGVLGKCYTDIMMTLSGKISFIDWLDGQ